MTTMMLNEGRWDRFARVFFGMVLIAVGLAIWGIGGAVVALIGLVPLITGLTGYCPLYALFKINTCTWKR